MILSVLRCAATWLAFSATAVLVAGCGGSGHLSSTAQALEFANAVSLRPGGDLPASRWAFRPCRRLGHRPCSIPAFRSEHANTFGCGGGHLGVGAVISVKSRVVVLKRNARERASVAHPEAEVASIVYVMPNAALARQELAAAHACVASLPARGTAFNEPGLPEHFASLHASLPGVSVAGLRRRFRHRELLGGAVSPPEYADTFTFVVGRAEISLIADGSPEPLPSAMEQRLLSLLYSRARAHEL
jgi:hypothetical protein